MKSLATAVSTHRPFGPAHRDADEQQGGEVRNHERATAIRGRLTREAEEVSEADGRS
jgi:hypothetical protein